MVMRRDPIGGSSGTNTRPRQTNRPTYEDFQPRFELKEEQEAHRVLVHLPGLFLFFLPFFFTQLYFILHSQWKQKRFY